MARTPTSLRSTTPRGFSTLWSASSTCPRTRSMPAVVSCTER